MLDMYSTQIFPEIMPFLYDILLAQYFHSLVTLSSVMSVVARHRKFSLICFILYCCNLSVGVALNVRFTTNRMCVKNNTHIYVARTSNNKVILSGNLYCCLLPQCEALFRNATKWGYDQDDVEIVPGAASTKRTCDWCGLL